VYLFVSATRRWTPTGAFEIATAVLAANFSRTNILNIFSKHYGKMTIIDKALVWLGSSLEDLKDMPTYVQRTTGFDLRTVQQGDRPRSAKTLSGYGGASVLELREDFDKDTYRAVYAIKYEEAVYVLHCFMKKSTIGNSPSKQDKAMIDKRLKLAEREHEKWLEQQKKR
jgi:phage-related protein